MKMRRSLWRKLVVLLFAVLTAVSVFLTVRGTIPVIATSGLSVQGTPVVESAKDPEDETSYLSTVRLVLRNDSSSNIKVRSVTVTVGVGSANNKDLDSIPVTVSNIAPGKTYEVVKTFSTKRAYDQVNKVGIETSSNLSDVIYGPKPATKFPSYVKALMAISVILFGVFIYTCVLLYKSPKKRVHHKHKHHHHHHHHSSSQSDSSESHKEA